VIAQLRSELLKQRTSRANLALFPWMVGLVALLVLMHVFSLSAETLATHDGQLKVVGWGTGISALFASLLGAMSITGEIRYGTIRPTLLAEPRRTRVIAAKVSAGLLAGALLGLFAEALTAAVESAGLATRGIHIALNAGDLAQLLAGGAAAAALFAAIGVGAGAIIRTQVGAVVGLCVWLLLIETTLIGNLPSVGKFAPGASAGALAGAIQTQTATKLLAPGLGALLLVIYAAGAAGAGALATARRDIG
jgi:ABC-type transport system involved in multi-copper enzyme maturation permease subunit